MDFLKSFELKYNNPILNDIFPVAALCFSPDFYATSKHFS